MLWLTGWWILSYEFGKVLSWVLSQTRSLPTWCPWRNFLKGMLQKFSVNMPDVFLPTLRALEILNAICSTVKIENYTLKVQSSQVARWSPKMSFHTCTCTNQMNSYESVCNFHLVMHGHASFLLLAAEAFRNLTKSKSARGTGSTLVQFEKDSSCCCCCCCCRCWGVTVVLRWFFPGLFPIEIWLTI